MTSKVFITPQADLLLTIGMETLRCSKCGTTVGVVTDHRFGLAPASSLCLACSMPAHCRTRGFSIVRTRPLVALALRI
jgi:hypothetical protein